MRTFLSKVLLTFFIFIFTFSSVGGIANATDIGGALGPGGGGQVVPVNPVVPSSQGYSWQPPAGPPLGNNTPSPVNIGPQSQTKRGPLTIQGNFKGQGINIFESNPVPGIPALSGAFTPFYFFNNVFVGSPAEEIYPTVDIQGTLRYKPPAPATPPGSTGGQVGGQLGTQDGQTLPDGQPESGYVLTSTDNLGTVSWRPGLPNGGADGNTLIWSETCNCWTTGPGGGTGTVLPAGEAGQTMWFNGETGQWEATNKIEYFSADMNNLRVNTESTNLNSRVVGIGNSTSLDSQTTVSSNYFNVRGYNTITLGSGDGNVLSQATNILSQNVTIRPYNVGNSTQNLRVVSNNVEYVDPSNTILQTLNFNSSNVNYNDPNGTFPQNVTFNSSSVKFKGPISDPALVNPGLGRIPYSVDDEGTFRWNENLTYNQEQIAGQNFGVLNINNPQNGFGLLRNQGYTNLLDDVVVGEQGQVFLTGLISGYLPEREQGLIKPLCYVETTKRIVNCNMDFPTENPNENGDVFTPGLADPTFDGTLTYTPDSSQQYHEFDHTGTVNVKYCAGGGGGGGGGRGQGNSEHDPFQGGNGGGGGAAGDCSDISLDVTPGDRLYFVIGEGGEGGSAAVYNQPFSGSTTNTFASMGEAGGITQLFFRQSDSETQNQVGQTMIGGPGGQPGRSSSQGLMGLVASHGNSDLATGWAGWWFNGGLGRFSNGQLNDTTQPGSNNTTCNACGGAGGMGEAYDSNGNLRTPSNNPMTSYSDLSYRGGGGVAPGTTQNSYTNRNGVAGRGGGPSFGGGGGGGSFGQLTIILPTPGIVLRGGAGGPGGDGYVTISGLPNYNGSTSGNEWVWSSPGTYTATQTQILNGIPSGVSNVTVELWGAGGGAGDINVPGFYSSQKFSGAGGGGGYKKISVPIQELSQYEFNVGSRGLNGGTVTTMDGYGDTGGVTTAISPSGSVFSAFGGRGGDPFSSSDSTPSGGLGGSMNPVSTPPNGQPGTSGQDGAQPSSTTVNCSSPGSGEGVGFGGWGAGAPRTCKESLFDGSDTIQGQASHGRIRISW